MQTDGIGILGIRVLPMSSFIRLAEGARGAGVHHACITIIIPRRSAFVDYC